jgi:hypothetical protein
LGKAFPEGGGTTYQEYTKIGVDQGLSRRSGDDSSGIHTNRVDQVFSRRSGDDSSGVHSNRSLARLFQKKWDDSSGVHSNRSWPRPFQSGDDSSGIHTNRSWPSLFQKELGRLLRSTHKLDLAKAFPEGVGTTPQEYKQTGVVFWA